MPFDGESVGEVLMKHLTAQPDLSKLAEPYRSVVARALEKDPARRFATVGEMATAVPTAAVGSRGMGSVGWRVPEPPAKSVAAPFSCPSPEAQGRVTLPYQPAAAGIAGEYADQEPIAQFVLQQWQRLRRRWQRSNLHPGAKRLIVAVCILSLLVTANLWLPAGAFLLLAYGGYRIVRFVYRLCFGPTPAALPVASPVARGRTDAQPVEQDVPRSAVSSEPPAAAVILKPLAVRASDLVGSLLVAAAVTAVMCVAVLLMEGYRGVPLQSEQCAWLYLVSLAGAWIVLTVAKVWEGSRGERMLRHFSLMTIGFGLGLAAFGVADVLMVRLPNDPAFSHHAAAHWVPSAFYRDGQPMAMAYMAAFATLLAVLRWWLNADPLRGTRLSLWSLLVTVVFANVIATAWQFPQPWLMMVAACMSVSVQLSSPWVPTYARLRPQRKKVI